MNEDTRLPGAGGGERTGPKEDAARANAAGGGKGPAAADGAPGAAAADGPTPTLRTAASDPVREALRRAALPITPKVSGFPATEADLGAALARCARLVVDYVVAPLREAARAAPPPDLAEIERLLGRFEAATRFVVISKAADLNASVAAEREARAALLSAIAARLASPAESAQSLVERKLERSKTEAIPAFCKSCGRDVHDFQAPDDEWARIAGSIPHRGRGAPVLCYDCFEAARQAAGAPPTTWRLASPAVAIDDLVAGLCGLYGDEIPAAHEEEILGTLQEAFRRGRLASPRSRAVPLAVPVSAPAAAPATDPLREALHPERLGTGDEDACAECGDSYVLRDGEDPTPECDRCAQEILANARRALASPASSPAPSRDAAPPPGLTCLACMGRPATRYARFADGGGVAVCGECHLDDEIRAVATFPAACHCPVNTATGTVVPSQSCPVHGWKVSPRHG